MLARALLVTIPSASSILNHLLHFIAFCSEKDVAYFKNILDVMVDNEKRATQAQLLDDSVRPDPKKYTRVIQGRCVASKPPYWPDSYMVFYRRMPGSLISGVCGPLGLPQRQRWRCSCSSGGWSRGGTASRPGGALRPGRGPAIRQPPVSNFSRRLWWIFVLGRWRHSQFEGGHISSYYRER
jgi:hypothetical protein